MKACHALISGNALRRLIAVAALGVVQVAQASTYPIERQARIWESFQGVFDRPNSVALDLKYPRTGAALPTSSPAGSSPVGNMGVTQAGTGVRVAGNVSVPLGNTGKAVAVAAGAGVSRAAFLAGLGAAASNPLVAIGLAVAAPAVVDWLDSGGVSLNPDVTGPQNAFRVKDPNVCTENCYFWTNQWGSKTLSPSAMCGAYTVALNHPGSGFYNNDGGACLEGQSVRYYFWRHSSRPADQVAWLPKSMDDIVQYMDRPEAPVLTPSVFIEGVTKAGIDPFGAQSPSVTVTGPATVPGANSQTSTQTKVIPGTTTEVGPGYSGETQPATRTTTQSATHNVTYNDNRVTYNTTNNTTTTVTNNVTGATETAVQQETKEEDGETECQKNPQSLACADLDTPEGEIPRTTASVTYQVEDTFGSGACPADVYGQINGQSVKLYDYAQTCSYVSTYVRPMLLLMCALGALFIVMPGKADA